MQSVHVINSISACERHVMSETVQRNEQSRCMQSHPAEGKTRGDQATVPLLQLDQMPLNMGATEYTSRCLLSKMLASTLLEAAHCCSFVLCAALLFSRITKMTKRAENTIATTSRVQESARLTFAEPMALGA